MCRETILCDGHLGFCITIHVKHVFLSTLALKTLNVCKHKDKTILKAFRRPFVDIAFNKTKKTL